MLIVLNAVWAFVPDSLYGRSLERAVAPNFAGLPDLQLCLRLHVAVTEFIGCELQPEEAP